MMNEPHSLLAPSSKEWFYCGFAVRFLATKEEESNEQSEFGSECHALGEAYVRLRLNIVDDDNEPVDIEKLKQSFKHYDEEMERLWDEGKWNQEKIETTLQEHLRTPYNV